MLATRENSRVCDYCCEHRQTTLTPGGSLVGLQSAVNYNTETQPTSFNCNVSTCASSLSVDELSLVFYRGWDVWGRVQVKYKPGIRGNFQFLKLFLGATVKRRLSLECRVLSMLSRECMHLCKRHYQRTQEHFISGKNPTLWACEMAQCVKVPASETT